MSKADQLIQMARSLSPKYPQFFNKLGPGDGDRATITFMEALRQLALTTFGSRHHEFVIRAGLKFAVDFYFREEACIVEVAMGLRNSMSEYERDILKAIIAKEAGNPVERLVFLSKPGAIKKTSQPGSRAFADWTKRNQGINIEVLEFSPQVARILDEAVEDSVSLPTSVSEKEPIDGSGSCDV